MLKYLIFNISTFMYLYDFNSKKNKPNTLMTGMSYGEQRSHNFLFKRVIFLNIFYIIQKEEIKFDSISETPVKKK